MAINFASDLNQAACPKTFNRAGPDHISPATLLRAFLQFSGERFLQHSGFLLVSANSAVSASFYPEPACRSRAAKGVLSFRLFLWQQPRRILHHERSKP